MSYDSHTYLSPFTWRYGSQTMREIWSEFHKRSLMRDVWVALATAQCNAGLVTEEELDDLKLHQDEVDVDRAREAGVDAFFGKSDFREGGLAEKLRELISARRAREQTA